MNMNMTSWHQTSLPSSVKYFNRIAFLLNVQHQPLTFTLNEQDDIFKPSAKKSQDTTATIPKFANAPLINPHGNASILIAITLAISTSPGNLLSHLNCISLNTNTPRWLVWSLSICFRNTSVQNSLQMNLTASSWIIAGVCLFGDDDEEKEEWIRMQMKGRKKM